MSAAFVLAVVAAAGWLLFKLWTFDWDAGEDGDDDGRVRLMARRPGGHSHSGPFRPAPAGRISGR